jgi:hypothetical protein
MSDHDEDEPKVCPVTGTYCSSDESDICIDYGCIRKPSPPRNYGRIIYGPEGSGWWEYEQ